MMESYVEEQDARGLVEQVGAAERRIARPWGDGALLAAGLIGVAVLVLAVWRYPNGPPRGLTAPWIGHLQRMEQALARGDVRNARAAWGEAYDMARLTMSWEGMLAVGEAYRRLGERTGQPREAAMRARGLFRVAFTYARTLESLEGVLSVAEGFAGLGDFALAELALGQAESLAGEQQDPRVKARLDILRDRLGVRSAVGGAA